MCTYQWEPARISSAERLIMSFIPSPIRVARPAGEAAYFTLSAPVTVSFSGEGADGVAGYLCNYLNAQLRLESLAEPQEDASNTEGGSHSQQQPQ